MKNYAVLQIVLLIAFNSAEIFAQSKQEPFKTIIIDPGHGGRDPGATGRNGLKEKDVVLQLAKEILQLAEKEPYPEIYLTRYTDNFVPLKERSRLARILKADLFISFHCNHSTNPGANGMEIFVTNSILSENLATSILIANNIQKVFIEQLLIKSRGIKFGNFQVLRETAEHFPTLLVELCFLSNIDEENYLSEKSSLKAMAYLLLQILTNTSYL